MFLPEVFDHSASVDWYGDHQDKADQLLAEFEDFLREEQRTEDKGTRIQQVKGVAERETGLPRGVLLEIFKLAEASVGIAM